MLGLSPPHIFQFLYRLGGPTAMGSCRPLTTCAGDNVVNMPPEPLATAPTGKSRAVDLSVLRAYRLSKRNGTEWQTDYRASSHASPNHQTDVRVVCDGPMLNRRSL